ncbi:VRR-NUC domain-containing protein [Dehalobacter restrictus]|uniref:VRR-NUC domain-containing protein n=1 Tax=Dehalobacter restrictus TaxID=55583 RepID=UPI00338ECC2E
MSEKYIEKKLIVAVKNMGGIAPKFVSPGFNGMPDRLVLLPMSRIAFVELKAPGKVMRPLQVRRKRQLEALGFLVYCIDSVEQIDEVLKEMGGDAE